jgi:hypothetical protein
MCVRECALDEGAKVSDIDAQTGIPPQDDVFAIQVQPLVADSTLQGENGTAEITTRGRSVAFRPEQLGQGVTGAGSGRKREISEQRKRLAAIQRNAHAITSQVGRTEEV